MGMNEGLVGDGAKKWKKILSWDGDGDGGTYTPFRSYPIDFPI